MELRENEYKTLEALKEVGGKAAVDQVVDLTGLAHAAVMRAVLSLSEKGIIKVKEEEKTVIRLTSEGETYAEVGLPERRLFNALVKLGGKAAPEEIAGKAGVDKALLSIALGWLHRKGWAKLVKGTGRLKALVEGSPPIGSDEKLLSMVYEKKVLDVEGLDADLREAVDTLKRRNLVEVSSKVVRWLELTDFGWNLVRGGVKAVEEVSQLTPELIVSGKWRDVKFRRFNVVAPGPHVFPGKVHPLRQVIRLVREVFLEMGFTEIRGPIVEVAFWNFDALFQPQDHPAREMHDTFYLEYPSEGRLPDKKWVERVAETHENGWVTGSTGWRYKWRVEEAKRLVLRTHTTATTIRYLAEHRKPPIRVFSVDRVYRNEKLDYKHLAEFHQIDGVIMDRRVTFRDLIGTLREFYRKLGLHRVQFWPVYFPYTEPSAQAMVYVPRYKAWFELAGMGMFRPEVLRPLGIRYPVLAWGASLERLAMLIYGIEDIRLLYKNDLGWIRRVPVAGYKVG